MSTGVMADLITAVGNTEPDNLANLSASGTSPPYEFATDWEIGSVDALVQNTSGPYCADDNIEVEITYTSPGSEFARLKERNANYTINTSQNCSLSGQTGAVFNFTVDSNVGDTTGNTIGITFDNVFNDATGTGVEQTTTFDTVGYDVTCDAIDYDSTNDDVTVTYTIECGSPDYDVELYRDNESSSGGPTLAASDTQTSTGQYTITDTNPNSGDTSDEYRVDVIDASGGGTEVQCTITANFPD